MQGIGIKELCRKPGRPWEHRFRRMGHGKTVDDLEKAVIQPNQTSLGKSSRVCQKV
jgi:hypothetical protein